LAIDEDETADPGNETTRRDQPGVALHQLEKALDKEGQFWHFGGSRRYGENPGKVNATSAHSPED
jgi:hypothetical protein